MKGKTLKSEKKGPAFGAGPTIAEVSGTVAISKQNTQCTSASRARDKR